MLAGLRCEMRGFGTKFYRPDALPDTNQEKYTLGFIFSASSRTPEGQGSSLSFALAL